MVRFSRRSLNPHPNCMVVPLHAEGEWSQTLADLPAFVPGPAPILFLSPHPDDETLAAGGLIAAQRDCGHSITLIAVTDGEHAYAENAGLAELRTREQTLAAGRLDIASRDVVRLHLRDSDVTSQQDILVERLLPYTSSQTHLLAPWPRDFHPDHEACGEAAQELSRQTGARLTFYFFWTWHRGTPAMLDGLPLQAFPLSSAQQTAKAEALALHASQLQHPSGDPILHEIHLWPARLPYEVYLPA